jgi:hypothetical protein
MKKILGLLALVSLLATVSSCSSKMDTVMAPKPHETPAVPGGAAADQPGTDASTSSSNTVPSGTTPTPTATGVEVLAEISGTSILGTVDGDVHAVSYTGGYQDLVIPMDPSIVKVSFTLRGADGGYARVHDTDILGNSHVVKANGGSGASANATFEVGSGAGQIPHGSTLRFIVGGSGSSGNSGGVVGAGFDYGGGGGGTAVLVRPPLGGSFTPLAAAGGGAGAYQGMFAYSSVDHENGQGGRSGTSGGSGNGDLGAGAGGTGGNGGGSNPAIGSFGGGGGGAFTPGHGVDCVGVPDGNPSQAGEGGAGGQMGGYGGDADGCFNFTWRNGGFGYGGGGAGSGAGGGGFVAGNATLSNTSSGGNTGDPSNGGATYQYTLNAPPLVSCKNHTLYLDANGLATLVPSDVTASASDPEGGPLQFSLSRSNFDCSDVGTQSVTLTVTDDVGQTASCDAEVSVQDVSPPVITSVMADPAELWPANHRMHPVTVTTKSSDNCAGASCRIIAVSSSERLNATGDGNTEPDWEILSDDTVSLRAERSGTGVGRVYTITVECTDASGNKSQSTTSVIVPHDVRGLGKNAP